MHIVFFDHSAARARLLPLAWTRPVGNLRVGILTIAEKWAKRFGAGCSFLTAPHLQPLFPYAAQPDEATVCLVSGGVCPDEPLSEAVAGLRAGEALWSDGRLVALQVAGGDVLRIPWDELTSFRPRYFDGPVTWID